jgi:hypothetical protein
VSFMTRLPGVPDTDEALPGMAFFAGTGPYGKTCGDCKFRGLVRESQRGTWNEKLQQIVHRHYRTTQCSKYKSLAGHHGSPVKEDYPCCKYFEQKVDRKPANPSAVEQQSKMNTDNKFMVSINGDNIIFMEPPKPYQIIPRKEALMMAAWIVALADNSEDNEAFDKTLTAVLSV